MTQVTLAKSAFGVFFDIEVEPNPDSRSSIYAGLDDILQTIELVLESAFKKMRCLKFYLICDAIFQVISFFYFKVRSI